MKLSDTISCLSIKLMGALLQFDLLTKRTYCIFFWCFRRLFRSFKFFQRSLKIPYYLAA